MPQTTRLDPDRSLSDVLKRLYGNEGVENIRGWWANNRASGESLVDTMLRNEILLPTACRTMELAAKGFIADVAPTMLFREDGLTSLSETANRSAPDSYARTGATQVTVRLHEQDTTVSDVVKTVAIGQVLGRCLLTNVIGRGGCGTIYSALHQNLNMPVAVKVLDSHVARNESSRFSLKREAQILARLNHEHVVRVLDFEDGDIPFAVMELIDGPSLHELIAQSGGLRLEKAVAILRDVVDALQFGWKHQIVHRDIKPANILLTREGVTKLADLGLAVLGDDPLVTPADSGKPVGTCNYMSPEQIRNVADLDFRADIYSLGCTFFHALTGSVPFPGRSPRDVLLKHLNETPPAVPLSDPHMSDRVTRVIAKMLAKNRDDRHQSYAELDQDLGSIETEITRQAMTVPDLALTPGPTASAPRRGLIGSFWRKR